MRVEAGPYKYQGLQVLVTVILGFVHVAFYLILLVLSMLLIVMPLPTVVGIVIGALEMAIAWKLPPDWAVLKLWLFAAGVITTIYSLGCLLFVLAVLN